MPLKRIEPVKSSGADHFVADLSAELQRSRDRIQSDVPPGAPEIIEEVTPIGIMHVTVIWDAWSKMPVESRSRVILDAYRKVGGDDEMRKISVALGLTGVDASRLGITFS